VSTFDTTFTSEQHGFPWPNHFRGRDIVASWLDQGLLTMESAGHIVGLVHGGPPLQLTADMLDMTSDEVVEELTALVDGVALSAGMCLTALERHRAAKSPWTRKPGRKSKNFAQLAAAQFKVMGAWPWLLEVTLDMNRPDVAHIWNETPSLGDLSTDVWWPRIRRRLLEGEPVPLVLLTSRWNPFDNRVVIACGGRELGGGREVRLDLYDPDHPTERTYLNIDLRRLNSFRLGPKSVYASGDRGVRGFKRMRTSSAGENERSRELAAQIAATA
jgi:hypothetical protein